MFCTFLSEDFINHLIRNGCCPLSLLLGISPGRSISCLLFVQEIVPKILQSPKDTKRKKGKKENYGVPVMCHCEDG